MSFAERTYDDRKVVRLGLPLGESMRCNLFDGFPGAVANR